VAMSSENEVKTLMPKPVCMTCKLFYRAHKNGVYLTEMAPIGVGGSWIPYKVWQADLWKCKGCGHEILSGFGHNPVSIQHMEGFKEQRISLGADEIEINDC